MVITALYVHVVTTRTSRDGVVATACVHGVVTIAGIYRVVIAARGDGVIGQLQATETLEVRCLKIQAADPEQVQRLDTGGDPLGSGHGIGDRRTHIGIPQLR